MPIGTEIRTYWPSGGTAGRNSLLQPKYFLTFTQIVSLGAFSFPLSAILNYQAGYRCTLVPRLPFPFPRSPFFVSRSSFPVPRSPFPFSVLLSPLPVSLTLPHQAFDQPNFESHNLWCLFAKSCWNINTRTILSILFSLLCVKYIFVWFYRSVGFEGNIKCPKKWYYVRRKPWNAQAVIKKMVFTSPEAMVVNWHGLRSFLGKKIKPQRRLVKNPLSLQTHLGTYVNLYSFERTMKWKHLSRVFFSFEVNKHLRLQITLKTIGRNKIYSLLEAANGVNS